MKFQKDSKIIVYESLNGAQLKILLTFFHFLMVLNILELNNNPPIMNDIGAGLSGSIFNFVSFECISESFEL